MNGQDGQFENVLRALAHYNRVKYDPDKSAAYSRERAEEVRKQSPLHIKAMERRKKRKRGGHK